jgi:hypothetical protein
MSVVAAGAGVEVGVGAMGIGCRDSDVGTVGRENMTKRARTSVGRNCTPTPDNPSPLHWAPTALWSYYHPYSTLRSYHTVNLLHTPKSDSRQTMERSEPALVSPRCNAWRKKRESDTLRCLDNEFTLSHASSCKSCAVSHGWVDAGGGTEELRTGTLWECECEHGCERECVCDCDCVSGCECGCACE